MSKKSKKKKIVIIGGGIAGLATLYNIRFHAGDLNKDLDITLVEKAPRLGGNIRTELASGYLIEGGPDCFLSEKPWALELCQRLGLEASLMPTNPGQKTFVLSGGRLHELPEGVILMVPTRILPLLTSRLITLRGKIRMGLELFIPRRSDSDDESLGHFVRRRLGREALEKIAEPLVAGVHAGDPDTMSIKSSFPRFVELEQKHGSLILGMLHRIGEIGKMRSRVTVGGKKVTMFMTLEHGLSELIERLLMRISELGGATFVKGRGAARVEKKGGHGYDVVMEDGSVLGVDAVVLAVPAYAASALVKNLEPVLAGKLLTIPYVSTATVSLAYDSADIPRPLEGFGFVVPKVENRRIMAASWTSRKWSRRAPEGKVLIRCFVGGANRPELAAAGDDEMIAMVREELRDIVGIEAEPELVRVFRWKDSMPQYTIGHEDRVSDIETLAGRHPGLLLTGSAYHGLGISDTVREAETTAKNIIRFLTANRPEPD